MHHSALARLAAALAVAGSSMVLLAGEAHAQSCDPGWRSCIGGCIPEDGTCCGTSSPEGLPEYCASSAPVCCDGGCAVSPSDCGGGGSGGGGTDSCEYAFDGVCDEPGYCATGTDTTDCSGSGAGGGGTGGTCDAGLESCDGGCMPSGATCCFDGAHYCDAGEECCSDGCYPAGSGCSGSSSGNDSCQWAFDGVCDEPGACPSGTDATDCGGSSGGGWGTTAPGGSGSGGGGQQCVAAAAYEGCESVDACCDGTDCWYVTDDGTTFYCNGSDCYAAADQVVSYCEEQASACAAAPATGGHVPGAGFAVAAVAAIGLAARRRLRRDSPHGRRRT